jgi:hypothetical protein
MEVVQTGGAADAADEWFGTLEELLVRMAELVFGTRRPEELGIGLQFDASFTRDLLRREFREVFFKQFRSAEDGLRASLQQIVEGRYKIGRVNSRLLPQEYRLIVRDLDSHPVIDELGLTSQPVRVAFTAALEFEVGRGKVLWDAASAAGIGAGAHRNGHNGHNGNGRLAERVLHRSEDLAERALHGSVELLERILGFPSRPVG